MRTSVVGAILIVCFFSELALSQTTEIARDNIGPPDGEVNTTTSLSSTEPPSTQLIFIETTVFIGFPETLLLIIELKTENCPNGVGLCPISQGTGCSNCFCDSDCEFYNDCCEDAVHVDVPTTMDTPELDCVNVHPLLSNTAFGAVDRFIQAVNSCPSSWEDDAIAGNCTSNTGLLPPATDLSTNITYKNIFCAICNRVSVVYVWFHKLLCYSPDRIVVTDSSKEMCEIIRFSEPPSLMVRECFSDNVVDTCPNFEETNANFPELTTSNYFDWVQLCDKYQRLVEFQNITFRNEYCTLCNGHVLTSFVRTLQSEFNEPNLPILPANVTNVVEITPPMLSTTQIPTTTLSRILTPVSIGFPESVITTELDIHFCQDGVSLCSMNQIIECSNCFCDSDCVFYNDCCEDAVHVDIPVTMDTPELDCVNVRPLLSNTVFGAVDRFIQAVNSCPSSWEDDTIAGNCTSNTGLLPPATDLSTNITYKNIFCAICNEVSVVNVWFHRLLCHNPIRIVVTNSSMEMCELIRFSEPRASLTIRECFSDDVVDTCPSFEVTNADFPELSLSNYSHWVLLCDEYQRLVESEGITFRNEYCALCNGHVSTAFLLNFQMIFLEPVDVPIIFVEDISTVFLVPQFEIRIIACNEGQVFDSQVGECRNIFVFDPFMAMDGPVNCTTLNLACNCTTLIALNESEFEYAGNSNVLFNGDLFEIELNTTDGRPVICVNFSQNGTVLVVIYPARFDVITYIGCSLSIIACALTFLTFGLFKELRTLTMKILLNIVATIVAVNLLLILIASGAAASNSGLCQAVAVLLHFFILSQFMWMTVMAGETMLSFYMASRLIPVSSESSGCKFVLYILANWIVPSVIVGTSVVVDYTTDLVQYGGSSLFGNRSCWINHFNSLIILFFVPIAIATILQLIFFVAEVILLYISHRSKTKNGAADRSIPYFRILLALFFASNIMWVFGFLALLIGTTWAWYPFVILQSIQGLVIFLGFFSTRKILSLYTSTLNCFPKNDSRRSS